MYQGPPCRLGYQGLGEPLCWLAFGPLATAAALLALRPPTALAAAVPWGPAFTLGAGPALATTLVLFCSHFHQVDEDAAHGKRSPVVRLGTARAAALVPLPTGRAQRAGQRELVGPPLQLHHRPSTGAMAKPMARPRPLRLSLIHI